MVENGISKETEIKSQQIRVTFFADESSTFHDQPPTPQGWIPEAHSLILSVGPFTVKILTFKFKLNPLKQARRDGHLVIACSWHNMAALSEICQYLLFIVYLFDLNTRISIFGAPPPPPPPIVDLLVWQMHKQVSIFLL